MNYCLEPLHSSIIDNNTLIKKSFNKDHNIFTHLGCVILRSIIGIIFILLSSNLRFKDFKNGILLLFFIIIIIFSSKFINNCKSQVIVWKDYLRPVLVYITASLLVYNEKYEIAGLLIIIEALMGLESRHNAFICSYVNSRIDKFSNEPPTYPMDKLSSSFNLKK